MAKPGYLNLRLTEETEAQLRAICDRLDIDPASRGAYAKAIGFALRHTTFEKETMFTSIASLNKWLAKNNSTRYIVLKSIGASGYDGGLFYYPVPSRRSAARLATRFVKESWQRARRVAGYEDLLRYSVEVADRSGMILASIDAVGQIGKHPDTEPEASYFAKVFENAKAELG